jgi:hypothetical protein
MSELQMQMGTNSEKNNGRMRSERKLKINCIEFLWRPDQGYDHDESDCMEKDFGEIATNK